MEKSLRRPPWPAPGSIASLPTSHFWDRPSRRSFPVRLVEIRDGATSRPLRLMSLRRAAIVPWLVGPAVRAAPAPPPPRHRVPCLGGALLPLRLWRNHLPPGSQPVAGPALLPLAANADGRTEYSFMPPGFCPRNRRNACRA